MSSSNQLLLSSLLVTISCAGVERAEIAREEPAPKRQPEPHPLNPDVSELGEMAEELEQHEAYLASERDSPLSIATAVLKEQKEGVAPAIGLAVVEVNSGGLGLRVAAELVQGTHHVYVLEDPRECSGIDPKKEALVGTPDPYRKEYLGALINVRNGPARFQRYMEEGTPAYERILGRPLVLVHSKGESIVCGVFRESDEERRREEAVSSR